jgi:antitoxin (DNA-binding transcriptional repressor) of toxin-antitoxin stability system
MMLSFSLKDAETRLAELVAAAARGEMIVIRNEADQLFQLTMVREDTSARGAQMAEALGLLAASDTLPDIPDPVAWQRGVRLEREVAHD